MSFTPEHRAKVLAFLKDHPGASQREIAKGSGVHRSKVGEILKDRVFTKEREAQGSPKPTKVNQKPAVPKPISLVATKPKQAAPEVVAQAVKEATTPVRRPPPPSAPPSKGQIARETVGACLSRLKQILDDQPHRNRQVKVQQALSLLESPEVPRELGQEPFEGDLIEMAEALFGVSRDGGLGSSIAALTVARAATVCSIIETEPEAKGRPLVDMGSLGNRG